MRTTKIKSIRRIGEDQVYNIRMKSDHHNYITVCGDGQPIHKNSHSCAYVMIAYWCLWLKSHYPAEWWATVMSQCKLDKLVKYINVARSEGVEFGSIDIENLTAKFSVNPKTNVVTLGLASLKRVKKAAKKLEGQRKYTDIDNFVMTHGKQKIVMERLILLGAFKKYHPSIKATWMWYQYSYCTGKDITALKQQIRDKLLEDWTYDKIERERNRQIVEYKKLYPRRKTPKKILNWKPKPHDDRGSVMALFKDDYTLQETLAFEKEYLGYYWNSPMDAYIYNNKNTINNAKENAETDNAIEVVVEEIIIKTTKTGKKMARMSVTDGLCNATVVVWENQLEDPYNKARLKEGNGVKIRISYDPNWNSFTMQRNSRVIQLERTQGI